MVMAEGDASAAKLADGSFRKTLYALEQWPSAIESLRNENHSPEFVGTFCGLLDRTLSELEVISELVDKQAKRQDRAPAESPRREPEAASEPQAPARPDGGAGPQRGPEPPEDAAPPTTEPKPPLKRARMKYTPLRKLSI